MDEKQLQSIMLSLQWEVDYRLRGIGKATAKAFLPEIVGLDSDFAAALRTLAIPSGKLLDIGTGLGSQAIQYARLGFEVTATDVSDTALSQARSAAESQGVMVSFLNDDILFSRLNAPFPVIADRGCFTILPKEVWHLYAANVSRLLDPDGFLLLKFDQKKQDQMEFLSSHFDVVESRASQFQREDTDRSEWIPRATFLVLRRRASAE